MSPRIIMVSGWMQSGKDSVGACLQRHGFRRVAFADALKDEASALFGVDRMLMDSHEGKATLHASGRTVREVLIMHGHHRREQDQNYWVKKVIPSLGTSDVVITDWRFPHEYATLRERFGSAVVAWRVNRWVDPPSRDASETSLDNFQTFDAIINNTGTPAQLTARVEEALRAGQPPQRRRCSA